jgi:AraC family transcriptional regulator, transcriptional activator of pobA
MDIPVECCRFPASMKTPSPMAVAFREVRHFKPDDWLHCEPIAVRGEQYAWTIPAHRHEGLHQLMILEAGAADLRLDQQQVALRAPAALLVAPSCVHSFAFEPSSRGWQVTVPTERLQRALQGAPALVGRLALSQVLQGPVFAPQAATGSALFDALAQEFERAAPGRHEALQAHLVLIACWLLRQGTTPAADESRGALRDTLVQRYRALLEVHLQHPQPLGFYAERLGVSADHLSRSCRAVTGQSALALLHDRQLLEARRLLAYTRAQVADVARELGFNDPGYFSRVFARRAGLSPQAYRARLLEGTALPPEPR